MNKSNELQINNEIRNNLEIFKDSLLDLNQKSNLLINFDYIKKNGIKIVVTKHMPLSKIWSAIKKHNNVIALQDSWSDGAPLRRDSKTLDWQSNAKGEKDLDVLKKLKDSGRMDAVAGGENSLTLFFGSIKWTDIGREVESPLIIVPARLTTQGPNSPYYVSMNIEEASPNEVLLRKMEQLLGRDGRAILEPQKELSEFSEKDCEEYFNAVGRWCESHHNIKFNSEYIAMGRISSDRFCMYKDIVRNAEKIEKNKLIRTIFGEQSENQTPNSYHNLDDCSLENTIEVLDTDSSQHKLIERAKNGESFIMHGPPGTGKSQTIVNIIASMLYAGKKVLFVSEKYSALKTVYDKIKDLKGIDGHEMSIYKRCLLIDDLENFKDIYNQLKASYEVTCNPSDVASGIKDNENKLKTYRDTIKNYRKELFDKDDNKISIYDIMGKISILGDSDAIAVNPPDLTNLCESNINKYCECLEPIQTALTQMGCATVDEHIWKGLDINNASHWDEISIKITAMREIIDNAITRLKGLDCGGIKLELTSLPIQTLTTLFSESLSSDMAKKVFSADNISDIKKKIEEAIQKTKEINLHTINKEIFDRAVKKDIQEYTINPIFEDFSLGQAKDCSNFLTDNYDMLSQIRGTYQEVFDSVNKKILAINRIEESENNKIRLEDEIKIDFDKEIFDIDLSQMLLRFRQSYVPAKDKGSKLTLNFKYRNDIKLLRGYCSAKSSLNFDGARDILEKLEKYKKHISDINQSYNVLFNTSQPINCNLNALKLFLKTYHDLPINNHQPIDFENFVTTAKGGFAEAITFADIINIEDLSVKISDIKEKVETIHSIKEIENKLDKTYYETRLGEAFQGVYTDWNTIMQNIKTVELLEELIEKAQSQIQTMQIKHEIVGEILSLLSSNEIKIAIKGIVDNYTDFCKSYAKKLIVEENIVYDFPNFNFLGLCLEDAKSRCNEFLNHDSFRNYVSLHADMDEAQKYEFVGKFIDNYLISSREKYPYDKIVDYFKKSVWREYLKVRISNTTDFKEYWEKYDVKELTDKYKTADKKYIIMTRHKLETELNTKIAQAKKKSEQNFTHFEGTNLYSFARKYFDSKSDLIKVLAPCMIMPVSCVSRLLDPNKYAFDIVIFDEASQRKAEHAITSLYRAPQAIISGDPQQMPAKATEYYQASEQHYDFYNANGGTDIPPSSILDFILSNDNNKLKFNSDNTLLFHYRSNHESLIKFSNEEYYNKKLITFPSPKQKTDNFGLVDIPIEYAEGIYSEGKNTAEASKVAELINEHFKNPDTKDKSLGVAVFGKNQANCINEMINTKYCDLKKILKTKTNMQYYISTVDNLQGNEMDVIILSVTYCGSNVWGHMNQSTARNKFNVAVTRAKDCLKFVHTVQIGDLEDSRTLDYIKNYLCLLGSYTDFASDVRWNTDIVTSVGNMIKGYFEYKKQDVDRIRYNFGFNPKSYRIPISILSKDKTKVVLAIKCETYRKDFSIRESIRICDEFLKKLGWDNIHELYATGWIGNSNTEIDTIKTKLNEIFES